MLRNYNVLRTSQQSNFKFIYIGVRGITVRTSWDLEKFELTPAPALIAGDDASLVQALRGRRLWPIVNKSLNR
jgi:hypothetical protein